MILNQSQAKAVYDAMCALNNLFGTLNAEFKLGPDRAVKVVEDKDGKVYVKYVNRETMRLIREEVYANQSDFAFAYNLG